MAAPKGKSAPAPVAEAPVGEIEVNSIVRFLGYADDVPEEDRVLTEGQEYPVLELPGEVDGEATGYVIRMPNPQFNPKKAPNAKTNIEFVDVEVFEEEIELVDAIEGEVVPADGDAELPIDYAYLETCEIAELIEIAKDNNIKLSAAQKKSAESMVAVIAKALELEPVEDEAPADEAPADEAPADEELPIDLEYLQSLDKAALIALATEEDVKLTPAQKKNEATLVAALAKAFELEEAAPVEEPVAPAKGKGKAATKPAATAAATKPAAKGKATTTAPATKAKGKPTTAPAAPAVDEEEFPELENEDESVVQLVADSQDLVATAQELESENAANEFRLGGVLYHLKKEGSWKTAEKGRYAENGGWSLFVQDHFNVEYRKAQYLIEIYVELTLAGIANPSEVVGNIGWTKASKIAKHMNNPDLDPAALIEAAENNSVADLSKALVEDFHIGGSAGDKGEKKTRITLKYRYVEEDARIMEQALQVAKDTFGGTEEDALFQIVSEWLVANNVETTAKAQEAEKATAPVKPAGRRTATAKA
jgi:hypothetical protein